MFHEATINLGRLAKQNQNPEFIDHGLRSQNIIPINHTELAMRNTTNHNGENIYPKRPMTGTQESYEHRGRNINLLKKKSQRKNHFETVYEKGVNPQLDKVNATMQNLRGNHTKDSGSPATKHSKMQTGAGTSAQFTATKNATNMGTINTGELSMKMFLKELPPINGLHPS